MSDEWLAPDVREAIRDAADVIAHGTFEDARMEPIAGVLACWAYGHPDRPHRRLSRFEQQPWRCWRCRTWWVTYYETSYACPEGQWEWRRVTEPIGSGEQ